MDYVIRSQNSQMAHMPDSGDDTKNKYYNCIRYLINGIGCTGDADLFHQYRGIHAFCFDNRGNIFFCTAFSSAEKIVGTHTVAKKTAASTATICFFIRLISLISG